MIENLLAATGPLVGVASEPLVLPHDFPAVAGHFAQEPGTVVLLSGGDLDCARHHVLGIRPWLRVTGTRTTQRLTAGGSSFCFPADPFDVLREVMKAYRFSGAGLAEPVGAGLFGYLAYDLKDSIEHLPRTSLDDLDLPAICLYAPSILVVQDTATGDARILRPRFAADTDDLVRTDIAAVRDRLSGPLPVEGAFSGDGAGFRSNFDRGAYLDAVSRVRDYIARGHAYQVNLSQRFRMNFSGDPWALFLALYRKNPAPFFAYVHAGDHRIVSTSPERFLLREGTRVETRPIKGTRPRGATPEADAALGRQLSESRKDDAELSMIVDLLRNDIGKVCAGGSVRVSGHKRLEPYQNDWHLVSLVEGTLDRQYDSVDLIRATFPGGSVTGCPKVRAMEIIDELEPVRRHVYTGAIGYLGFNDTLDLSIAIRTATVAHGQVVFSVGGGIVFDSDPADEFEETLHKGRTLMEVFSGTAPAANPTAWAWDTGRFASLETVKIPVTDLAVQYGDGFFETIRVDRGRIRRLAEHRKRFEKTWQALFDTPAPDVTWDAVIDGVISRNGLSDAVAAVKILATRGSGTAPRFDHRLVVMARAYRHRLTGTPLPGLRLATYPEPRQSPWARYKTLNYLYYHRAGRWAADQGADEAVIVNPDATVSETSTGNLLLVAGNTVIRPSSGAVLPGIMQAAVCGWFAGNGYRIATGPVLPEALALADQVLVTNALMGTVPAISLDGRPLATDPGFCQPINAAVLCAD